MTKIRVKRGLSENLDSVSIEGEKMNRIKFRRGSLNNKKNIDIEDGEPIYLTDTKRLYVSNEDVAINNVYVGTQEPNDPGINVWIDPQGVNNVIDMIYPIGSIYMSVSDADPATLFGGVWESFGTGRTLVGVDTSQAEFNTVQKTGGEKTHKLTINEMPIHKHTVKMSWAPNQSHNHSGGTYAKSFAEGANPSDGIYNSTDDRIDNAGGGQPHNNLQPYITVYMWKRTA